MFLPEMLSPVHYVSQPLPLLALVSHIGSYSRDTFKSSHKRTKNTPVDILRRSTVSSA